MTELIKEFLRSLIKLLSSESLPFLTLPLIAMAAKGKKKKKEKEAGCNNSSAS